MAVGRSPRNGANFKKETRYREPALDIRGSNHHRRLCAVWAWCPETRERRHRRGRNVHMDISSRTELSPEVWTN